jgi:predicted nicotinamide N-methyase
LGSGCGLPGFVAARYAKETVLTDYIDQVLDNLDYNMQLNCQEDQENSQNPINLKEKVRSQYLNWDEIDGDPTVKNFYNENAQNVKHGGKLEPSDIIMGSELTYSPLSVYTLVKVIQKYLKPEGVFYEVLSDDRDVNKIDW